MVPPNLLPHEPQPLLILFLCFLKETCLTVSAAFLILVGLNFCEPRDP